MVGCRYFNRCNSLNKLTYKCRQLQEPFIHLCFVPTEKELKKRIMVY